MLYLYLIAGLFPDRSRHQGFPAPAEFLPVVPSCRDSQRYPLNASIRINRSSILSVTGFISNMKWDSFKNAEFYLIWIDL